LQLFRGFECWIALIPWIGSIPRWKRSLIAIINLNDYTFLGRKNICTYLNTLIYTYKHRRRKRPITISMKVMKSPLMMIHPVILKQGFLIIYKKMRVEKMMILLMMTILFLRLLLIIIMVIIIRSLLLLLFRQKVMTSIQVYTLSIYIIRFVMMIFSDIWIYACIHVFINFHI
jgi:hypothetical protein